MGDIKYEMVQMPKLSNWKCYLFGSTEGNGLIWQPNEGAVPNAWWRFWQRIILGNRWEKMG